MDFQLGYTKEIDGKAARYPKAWNEYASTKQEKRPLNCMFSHDQTEEFEGFEYDCEPLFIFQLGSVPHKRYLLNLKIPTKLQDTNQKIGKIDSIEIIVSYSSIRNICTFIMFLL